MTSEARRAAELAKMSAYFAGDRQVLSRSGRRRQMDEAGDRARLPPGFTREAATVGGVAGLWLRPATPSAGVALLYLHGGGFVFGSSRSHAALAAWLSAAAGAPIFVPDYRLAPESPFPAALEDALACYRALRAEAAVAIAGDSAGGGLAVSTALAAQQADLPAAAGLFLASPWADLTLTSSTLQSRSQIDPVLVEGELRECAAHYLGGTPADDRLASPALAEFANLPPTLVHVGSREILLGDAIGLANRAAYADVAVQLVVWPDLFHVFQAYGGILSDARSALLQAGTWLGLQLRQATVAEADDRGRD